jgi:hypothetical protein
MYSKGQYLQLIPQIAHNYLLRSNFRHSSLELYVLEPHPVALHVCFAVDFLTELRCPFLGQLCCFAASALEQSTLDGGRAAIIDHRMNFYRRNPG